MRQLRSGGLYILPLSQEGLCRAIRTMVRREAIPLPPVFTALRASEHTADFNGGSKVGLSQEERML